jgi:hypothetical protein
MKVGTQLKVFRMLRRIFGTKRDEVAWGWERLCNKEVHSVSSPPSIIRMIKSRRIKWPRHAA